MSLNDMSVSRKLTLAFAVVVTVVLAMCGIVFLCLGDLTVASKGNNDSYDAVDRVDQSVADVWKMGWALNRLALTDNADSVQQIEAAHAEFLKDIVDARGFANGEGDIQQRIDQVKAAGDTYFNDTITPIAAQLRNPATHDQALVAAKSPEGATRLTAFDSTAADALSALNKWSDQWTAREDDAINKSRMALIVGGALALGLAALMGWLLSRMIATPVVRMTGAMQDLAGGDSTVEIPAIGRKDEVGQMAGAVQTFKDAAIEKLRLEAEAAEQRRQAELEREKAEAERAETSRRQAEVVNSLATGLERLSSCVLTFRLEQAFAPEYEKLRADFNAAMQQLQNSMKIVAANTAEIRSGSSEITQASDDLSKRTEQQAASLEETAAALDQITATVTKTAQGAREARDVVSAAKGDAEHSGTVVREAVAAMSQIETSSQQISQIIGVIDEIAFQTNLLALNAGVEAARAGDAGKGFAVVASEVRALAQRSAEAAKEIKSLISASSQQVDRGVSLVGETGEVLQRIVTQVAKINELVSEIAASAQEQASGLAQVNTAVNQMDQVTQQNAAMVEQSTAASHALAQETQELSRLISRFELGEEEHGHAERPAKRASAPAPRPAPRRSSAPVGQMKTTSQRQPAPSAEPEWSEF